MKKMRVATSDLDITLALQTGKNADATRRNLAKIKMPDGLKIDLYAVVPDVRHMAVAPSTNMLFVGTRKTTVWAVTDRNNGGETTEIKAFAPSLNFKNPNGVFFTQDGFLIVAKHNRVLTCRVGPDKKLYITLGQPFNVPPADKYQELERMGIGALVRMNLNRTGREFYASGVRNSVGQDFNPKDGSLWWSDNQTDSLGEEIPAEELNRSTKAVQHFGYPYWNGHYKAASSPAVADLKNMKEPANAVFLEIEFPTHQAQLGIAFSTGKSSRPRTRVVSL